MEVYGMGKGRKGYVLRTAMAPNIENSIKLARPRQHLRQLVRVRPQRLLFLEEGRRHRVGFEGLDRARVQRGLAALGGGDGQGDFVVEDVVGVGEFGLFE